MTVSSGVHFSERNAVFSGAVRPRTACLLIHFAHTTLPVKLGAGGAALIFTAHTLRGHYAHLSHFRRPARAGSLADSSVRPEREKQSALYCLLQNA